VIAATSVATLVLVAAIVLWRLEDAQTATAAAPVPTVPVTVEVLNGIGVDGLARAVTMRLREQGIDVVSYGNAGMDTLSVTEIVARREDTVPAARVRELLGVGNVRTDPDPRLLLDVSVVLGRDVVDSLFRP
jgi:calcineurin-like phosphoesterase